MRFWYLLGPSNMFYQLPLILTIIKLINRILGECLLISSLPGSALRTHVESLGKPRDVNKCSLSLVFSIFWVRGTYCFVKNEFQPSMLNKVWM